MREFEFDLFVIGAGSGGVRASRVAAALGARVAVAEERYFGGTCVNVGCVPKKLFSYAAHYHDDLEDSRGFGWQVSGTSFDWQTLVDNKNKEINRLKKIYQSILDNHEVTVFEARARITGPNEVEVDGKRISAKHILVAVGGWPWVPDFPGKEHAITSNEVFYLPELPDAVVILGGGYIAVEFASIFARLGCKTSLVYRRGQLLRGFDDDVREFFTKEMSRHVDLYLEDDIKEIAKENNKLKVFLNSGVKLNAGVCLAATGRKPMTAELGLENTDVETSDNGAIVVNEKFQTAEPSIFAVGDVIDRVALTPVALAEAEVVARSLFSNEKRDLSYDNIATAVFSIPSVATIGLSEAEAVAKGHEVKVFIDTSKALKHTLSGRDERALIKLVVDAETDRVLGFHFIGDEAGEIAQGIAIAMNCGATKADFDRTIGIHPTMAEEIVTMRVPRS